MIKSITLGGSLPHLYYRGDKEKRRELPLVGRTFEFKPGINVLVGANGSGKSSLLETIATRLMCFNYGYPKIDKELYNSDDTVWYEKERWYSNPEFMPWATLDCDAVPYGMYANPEFTPRGSHNRAYALCLGLGKDADKFYKMTDDYSSGQGMRNVIQTHFDAVKAGELQVNREAVAELEWRGDGCSMRKKARILDALLPVEGASPLFIYDEPERALDLQGQLDFWQQLEYLCKKHGAQAIVSSHSVIPLLSKNEPNFVEMTPGYLNDLGRATADLLLNDGWTTPALEARKRK